MFTWLLNFFYESRFFGIFTRFLVKNKWNSKFAADLRIHISNTSFRKYSSSWSTVLKTGHLCSVLRMLFLDISEVSLRFEQILPQFTLKIVATLFCLFQVELNEFCITICSDVSYPKQWSQKLQTSNIFCLNSRIRFSEKFASSTTRRALSNDVFRLSVQNILLFGIITGSSEFAETKVCGM